MRAADTNAPGSQTGVRPAIRTINLGATTGGVNNQQFAVDTGTNRLYAPNDSLHTLIDYDAAGNQSLDNYTGGGQRTYDAENHLISAQNLDHTWSYYTYDCNGRRIKRKINGAETWMLYGMGGELLAEYATDDSPGTPLREYGYRNGQLLIVAESGTSSAPGPTGFSAAPYNDSGVAKVTLSWTALAGATNYRVERAASKDGPYEFAGVSSSTTLIDGGVSAGSAHLYKVCAANGSNNCTSGYSNIALGVAVIFTDPDIKGFADDPSGQTVTTIKAAHVTELRSTVNAVRHLVPGMADGSWTNQTLTPHVSPINVEDLRDLRTNLDAALAQLGVDTPQYVTDNTLKGYREDPLNATPIKAAHIRELRARATSGHGGSGGGSTSASVHWLVTDQLGTPRMILDQSGSLSGVSRHDYLPFGEELTLNGRNSSNGYGGDSTRQKFTGYEADGETGLNFAQARYQSTVQGRFTSVDPLQASASVTSPQSLNRYSYVENNPVNFTDPTGMMLSDIGVYQTANPECARLTERAEDQGVKNWIGGRSDTSTFSSKWARTATAQASETIAGSFVPGQQKESESSISASVHFWAPGEGNPAGHLSASFSNGLYISFWPTSDPTLLEMALGGGSSPAYLNPNLESDIHNEHGREPENFIVHNLDGNAVRFFYNQLKADPGRWEVSRNCADIVAQALQMGGLVLRNLQDGESIPRDVLAIIEKAEPRPRINVERPTWHGFAFPLRRPN
jgi:RHS repeat-associated protein